jgi:acyl carrier protein phosphodiesterase
MNYLAHAYLSFGHPLVLVGNMSSDFIKGKKKFDFPAEVQKGIELHRAIDAFTDSHEATARARVFFRPTYRLYAGAFVDVVYDHFLANDPNEFPGEEGLLAFSRSVYSSLQQNILLLPERFQQMLPFMQSQNWLYHYRYMEGAQKSFGGLARRAAYIQSADEAFEILKNNYTALQQCYDDFFPAVKSFAAYQLEMLNKK